MQSIYTDRSRTIMMMDSRYVQHLNTSPENCLTCFGNSLDAPDLIPAGACKQVKFGDNFIVPDMVFAQRGMSVKEIEEREKIAQRLIAEIMETLNSEK